MGARVPDGHVPPSGRGRWKRRSYDRHREHVRAANTARRRAVAQLIEENREEFARLLAMTEIEQLELRIDQLQQQLADLLGDESAD
jgi:hypothetical protein